jgi:hypothetical protein
MANTLSPATAELAGTAQPRIRDKQGIRWGRIAGLGGDGAHPVREPVPVLVDDPHGAVEQRDLVTGTSRCCRSTRRC